MRVCGHKGIDLGYALFNYGILCNVWIDTSRCVEGLVAPCYLLLLLLFGGGGGDETGIPRQMFVSTVRGEAEGA